MKDVVKISNKIEDFKPKELFFAVFSHILVAVCGFFFSRAVVLDKLLPFGISLIAGSSLTYTPAAAIGVFLGYFIPAVQNNAFKYLSCLFAVLAIKLLLSNYKKLVNSWVFTSSITLISFVLISAATLNGMGGSIIDIFFESLLSAAGTVFVSRTFKLLSKNIAGLSPDELSTLLITVSIFLLGLNNASLLGISLGRILSISLILIASKYGGIVSGAISGITVAFTMCLSSVSGNIGVTLAVAGLMSGIFSSLGKYAQVFIVLIFGFIGAVSVNDINQIPQTVIETALGSVLFLILPRNAGIYLGKIFSSYPKVSMPTGFKKSLTMRLQMASNALKDVSETVDQVSFQLSKINSPSFSNVIDLIEQDACAGCKLRIHCWEKKREDTVNAVLEMTKAVKQGSSSPETASPQEFTGRCLRLSRVANASYKHYTDYASRIAAENRIDEVRGVVSDQFEGISSMLSDLAKDFEIQERFDNSAAENASMALKNLNIHIDECSSRIDKYGRMTIELKLKKTPELIINKAQVMKVVSIACERNFDPPTVSEVGGDVYITINEHADIKVDFGAEQSNANNNSMCGDAYKYFNDGKGHFIMILSDGMGTGGRAAVDGAMASGLMSRLIKAGFGFNCSLKILNSSMLFKSTDESLATVDIANIDLYTGITELYKAGAAPTIIRRSGKTGKAESTSLPAGILREIGFDSATVKCKVGDIIVLMSDGATTDGTDWIRAEIESWKDGSAQDLAEHLCACAKRRRTEKREDDITVLCAILNKAV